MMKIDNPYWDEISKYALHPLFGTGIHITMPGLNHWQARESLVRRYAWAIADPESVDFVAHYLSPGAIEIGAGTGYWAWQMEQRGVEIQAFDEEPPDIVPNGYFGPRGKGGNGKLVKTWHPVTRGGPEALADHSDRSLLLCWPPYGSSMAAQCLKMYRGDRLVYIGEFQGGCTGDDEFFELLEKQWDGVAEYSIMQYDGINDYIFVYHRKADKQSGTPWLKPGA